MPAAQPPKKIATPSQIDRDLARYGVPVIYAGVGGAEFHVPEKTKQALLSTLEMAFAAEGQAPSGPLPVLPASSTQQCYLPSFLRDRPAWGITLQLYELRSTRNWGIGDFEDLGLACEIAGRAGASFVGLTPLHALFMADPLRCSPYSPSNRSFLNPLYIAVDKLDFAPAPAGIDPALAAAREAEAVDYQLVGAIKLAGLRAHWLAWHQDGAVERDGDFRRFVEDGGSEMAGHALFEALSAKMVEAGHGPGWMSWPDDYRDRQSGAVEAFRQENADEIEFHTWLQWVATRQLEQAANRGLSAGLTLGLYFDYAVGEAPDGSATWSNASDYLPGFSIGAPPDPFSESGQDWGLALPSPGSFQGKARERRKRQFERILGDGGLFRLDHVMGLWQLFAVPAEESASQGAYIRYPIADALDMLAEISRRSSTIIIGEDLGNVPPGFRDLLQSAAILSYRVLYFEEMTQGDLHPETFPDTGLVCISTHDLHPLKGWWDGRDIHQRLALGLLSEASSHREFEEREERKRAILSAIATSSAELPSESLEAPPYSEGLVRDVHVMLAKSPCVLLAARLADLLGEEEATNIPGTPADLNWRRKVPVPIEAWSDHPLFKTVTAALAQERPR